MTEKTDGDSFDAALLDWDDRLQKYRRGLGSNGVAFHVPLIRASGAGRKIRQGGLGPQDRAPNYPVVLAWSGFLLFIGVGAFALGMAIHNEAIAQQHTPRPEPIYYCATGAELPVFEPCKEKKDERNI